MQGYGVEKQHSASCSCSRCYYGFTENAGNMFGLCCRIGCLMEPASERVRFPLQDDCHSSSDNAKMR